MIQKEIQREDGYNRAIIERMYPETGDLVATLQRVEADDEGNETVVHQDSNIVIPAGVIELTQEELEQLNPQPVIEIQEQ